MKALESRGYPVQIADSPATTCVTVLEESLEFCIEEPFDRVKHRPTPEERLRAIKFSWDRWPEYDKVPSGRLQLRITNAERSGARQTWADGKKQRLDTCLNAFIQGLIRAAEAEKAARARAEEWRRQWEEEERKRQQRERLLRREEDRARELDRQLQQWQRARTVREYVEWLKRGMRVNTPKELAFDDAEAWIAWVEAYAAKLDPVKADRRDLPAR